MRMRAFIVGLAVVGLAACGSSSGTKAASTNTTAKTDAGSSASAFTSQQCVDATKAMSDIAAQMPQAMSGSTADIEKAIKTFQDMANAAPSDIRADMKVLADAYAKITRAMADAHYTPGAIPSADALQKLAAAAQSLNTSDVQAASQRVQDWFSSKCGK